MTLRERRREARAQAVRQHAGPLAGVYARQNRYEFAESRRRAGWSRAVVAQAVGAGPLGRVRDAMDSPLVGAPTPLVAAVRALGILDSGRAIEGRTPRYGDDASPSERRTYAPSRLREV